MRYRKLWRNTHPDNAKLIGRAIALDKKYNMTLDQYQTIQNAQDNKCACCGTAENPGKVYFDVDHNHATGKVRGLLCGHCNKMIGFARDNPSTLRAGAEYLDKYRE